MIILYIFYLLAYLYPRDPNSWVFGGWYGTKFRGNSKSLFCYVKDNYPEVNITWVSRERSLVDELRKKGFNAFYSYSFKGICATLKAKYIIVSHGIVDVTEFASGGAIVIHLDHATFPIKNMSLSHSYEGEFLKKVILYLKVPINNLLVKPNYAITSSPYTVKSTKNHFGIDESKIMPVGIPKTDFLLKKDNAELIAKLDKSYVDFYKSNKKKILFLPTWRNYPSFDLFGFGCDFKKLNDSLEKMGALLAINDSPVTSHTKNYPDVGKYKNIMLFQSHGDEMNILLKRVALLVTDYSSLFADFLVFDKPMIFANFDFDFYLTRQSLSLDYENDLPGPKARDYDELIRLMEELFIKGKDEYAEKRKEMKGLIYANLDGNNRKRIVEFIKSIN